MAKTSFDATELQGVIFLFRLKQRRLVRPHRWCGREELEQPPPDGGADGWRRDYRVMTVEI